MLIAVSMESEWLPYYVVILSNLRESLSVSLKIQAFQMIFKLGVINVRLFLRKRTA
jgi:hypothetical protein